MGEEHIQIFKGIKEFRRLQTVKFRFPDLGEEYRTATGKWLRRGIEVTIQDMKNIQKMWPRDDKPTLPSFNSHWAVSSDEEF